MLPITVKLGIMVYDIVVALPPTAINPVLNHGDHLSYLVSIELGVEIFVDMVTATKYILSTLQTSPSPCGFNASLSRSHCIHSKLVQQECSLTTFTIMYMYMYM